MVILYANLVGLSSSTEKGEIEKILFSPYVFGADDNFTCGLTFCPSYMAYLWMCLLVDLSLEEA